MILTKYVKVKIEKRNRKKYLSIGFVNLECGDIISVSPFCLSDNSREKVLCRCDYCNTIYETTWQIYNKCVLNSVIHKCACKKCQKLKRDDTNMVKYGVKSLMEDDSFIKLMKRKFTEKYGVNNPSSLDFVKKKKIETCRKNFGVDYPMQSNVVMERSKDTIMQKYGVSHISKCEYYRNIMTEHSRKALFEHGTCASSAAQRHLCEIYNGILNFPVGKYNLDILIEDNIYIEYDGSGHDMNLKMGEITIGEYQRREYSRYSFIKNNGYRLIRIINKSDKLKDDYTMIILKEMCVEYLNNTNDSWIAVNIDTGEIITKE